MQIIWCLGGLGNQMFQYAFYRRLQLDGKNVALDISGFNDYALHYGFELERVFGLRINLANFDEVNKIKQMVSGAAVFQKIWWKISNSKPIIHQKYFGYHYGYVNVQESVYYEGYWQSEKYFGDRADIIRKDFSFPVLDNRNEVYAELIRNCNAVAIHIRMGDYVSHPLHGGISTLDYYQQAVDIIKAKVLNPHFFIFSNDISWCKINLNLENAVYITGNEGENSYKDMQLMSMCKHNIIANSSFSWWSAWLNNSQDKIVIAPKKWFNDSKINTKDLIPDGWHKI
jgi:hypothetical protein